jgi:hypothetical protein
VDFGVDVDFDTASGQFPLREGAELFTQFGKNYGSGMHQHNAEHSFAQMRIRWQRLPYKVVQRPNGLDASKPASGYDKS